MATANMSLSEQSSPVDIDIHRDELRARATKACRILRETFLLNLTPRLKWRGLLLGFDGTDPEAGQPRN